MLLYKAVVAFVVVALHMPDPRELKPRHLQMIASFERS